MRSPFATGMFRQALAATAVILLIATPTVAQESQQTSEGEKAAANAEQSRQVETEQEEATVLKVIEFESMSVNSFISAAQLAGVVDRAPTDPWQRLSAEQRARAQQQVYLATTPKSPLLFVRGPKKKVNKVEELAKKLDVPPEKMPEKLQFENGKHAWRVPQAEMNDTRELLRSLGLETAPSTFEDVHFLVFEGADETHVKQIEQVLEKLSESRDSKAKTAKASEQEI